MSTYHISQVFGFLPNFSESKYCTNSSTNSTFNCSDAIPPCSSPKRLEFSSLWQITFNYHQLCKENGTWLYNPTKDVNSTALTREAARIIAGIGETPFPRADIISRLTTWKAPLIQLLANVPRPPFGYLDQTLTILHLGSDPISSIEDLLYKLDGCQRWAVFWQDQIRRRDENLQSTPPTKVLHGIWNWKAWWEARKERKKWFKQRKRWRRNLAIISESYSELGTVISDVADEAMESKYTMQDIVLDGRERPPKGFSTECSVTGGALAADRATAVIPVFVAEMIFIAVFLFDLIRLRAGGEARTSGVTFVNIELHSIAFSALFFWLIPAVAMAAVIGASQTEKAIPRILERFRRDLKHTNPSLTDTTQELPELTEKNCDPKTRWLYGMYLWQPLRKEGIGTVWENMQSEIDLLRHYTGVWLSIRKALVFIWGPIHLALPYLIVILAVMTGVLISLFVPPGGWRCRTYGEMYFFFGWVGSHVVSKLIFWMPDGKWFPPKARFYIMFVKDLAVFGLAIAWIFLTQRGYYNHPNCYIGDDTGLILPEQPDAFDRMQDGLKFGGTYVNILVSGLVFQLIIVPGLVYTRYEWAIWTLMQKDNSASSLSDLNYPPDPPAVPPSQTLVLPQQPSTVHSQQSSSPGHLRPPSPSSSQRRSSLPSPPGPSRRVLGPEQPTRPLNVLRRQSTFNVDFEGMEMGRIAHRRSRSHGP